MEPKFCYTCRHVGVAHKPLRLLFVLGVVVLLAALVAAVLGPRRNPLGRMLALVGGLMIAVSRMPAQPRCGNCGGISLHRLDSPEAREARRGRDDAPL